MKWTAIFKTFLTITLLSSQMLFAQTPINLDIQISSGADDAEEYASGFVTLSSSDIEMVDEGGNELTVGFRFQNVLLPANATINQAYLQFYVDEVTVGTTDLNIFGDAAGNSAPFALTQANISGRNATNASANWLPNSWLSLNAAGPDQRSPDIAAIVQEIVGIPGWTEGNAMSFIIQGSGLRTAIAFNKNPNLAARLIIEAEGTVTPPGPVVGIVINEIAPFGSNYQDINGKSEDWVELYNTTNQTIQLGGLFLSDKLSELDKWEIPAGLSIAPGAYLTFFTDGDPEDGILHADFSLKAGGESIAISQMTANGLEIIDSYTFPETAFESTHARIPNATGDFVNVGTPSANANNDGSLLYLESPEILLPSSIYQGTQFLEISHPDPAVTIYYTLDGSDPDQNSLSYSGPVLITETAAVRAIAAKPGYANSAPDNEAYLIDENPNMDVIFITSDPDNFFDDEIGIYVDGTNGVEAYCATYPVNWARDWERPANFKMFQPDGTLLWDVNAGVEINGACSRNNAMKSLGISLRTKEYGDGAIEYNLYPERTHADFQRLKLRNSGQDFFRMGFRDMLTQNLIAGQVDIQTQSGIPAIVFLNGEFWGLHNLREKYSGEYFEAIYDVDEDDLDILKSPGLDWVDVKKGSTAIYDDLFAFMQGADLNDPASMARFEEEVDVNEFLNYWIAMTYLANYDWPANNLTIWRERKDGAKWRYCMADTDGSTQNNLTPDANPEFNTLALISEANSTSWPNHSNSTLFLRKLLERPDYRAEWIQRSCSFMELIYNSPRVNAMTDEVANLYEPNIPRHLNKWGNGNAMGGSIFSWQQWIDLYKNFFEERPDYYRGFMDNQYGLNGEYDLTVNFDANSGGKVLINWNTMDLPFNYTGTYMANVPVRLTAEADNGYTFLYWLETGETNPVIDFVSSNNATLTPIFGTGNCTPGDSCNDGDDCTENDIFDANCDCSGTFVDTDGDGICDAEDQCEGFDDNNDQNNNGIPDDCEPVCTDVDMDGVCAVDDCDDNDPAIPATPGNSCDDGNALTNNDRILADGCTCQGTLIPTGNYCDAFGDFPWHEWIANVKFNEIDYASGKSRYSNSLAVSTEIYPGDTYSIELTTGYSWDTYDEYWSIWIDLNNDRIFDPVTELVYSGMLNAPALGTFSATLAADVTLPDFVETGELSRMRIAMQRGSVQTDPCVILTFGEVEDYSVVLGATIINRVSPKNNKELLVYPVPAHDLVSIDLPNTVGIKKMRVLTATGTEVYQTSGLEVLEERMVLNVSDWPEGLYFIQVEVDAGKWRFGKMIVTGNK